MMKDSQLSRVATISAINIFLAKGLLMQYDHQLDPFFVW